MRQWATVGLIRIDDGRIYLCGHIDPEVIKAAADAQEKSPLPVPLQKAIKGLEPQKGEALRSSLTEWNARRLKATAAAIKKARQQSEQELDELLRGFDLPRSGKRFVAGVAVQQGIPPPARQVAVQQVGPPPVGASSPTVDAPPKYRSDRDELIALMSRYFEPD